MPILQRHQIQIMKFLHLWYYKDLNAMFPLSNLYLRTSFHICNQEQKRQLTQKWDYFFVKLALSFSISQFYHLCKILPQKIFRMVKVGSKRRCISYLIHRKFILSNSQVHIYCFLTTWLKSYQNHYTIARKMLRIKKGILFTVYWPNT